VSNRPSKPSDLAYYFEHRLARPIEIKAVTHTGSTYKIRLSGNGRPEQYDSSDASGDYWTRPGTAVLNGRLMAPEGRVGFDRITRCLVVLDRQATSCAGRVPSEKPISNPAPSASRPSGLFCPNRLEKPARGFSFAHYFSSSARSKSTTSPKFISWNFIATSSPFNSM